MQDDDRAKDRLEPHERLFLIKRLWALSRPLTPLKTDVRARADDCMRAVLFDVYGILPQETLVVGAGCRAALFAGDGSSLRLREDDARCRGVVP
ncbi:MAG: hypothetical protein LC725_03160, partial [Lentisphaerae bacterium]|nr:hypothetical protein [Lentisphaerota bacterium]